MNGEDILRSYCENPEYFEIEYGGWCELHTATTYITYKVSKEDKEILKEIGWEQIKPHTWKLEWWN